MPAARGAGGSLRPDAGRLTRFGEWLRRTRLDELSEPINLPRGG
jgi:lipopolysaccharide/colanic/teichoic acid biosynthesis glycosyltransferase